MLEGHLALKLIQFLEHSHENILCQVFLCRATRQITAHNSDHRRIQVFHQRTGGILVLPAHSGQAICDVQIQVVSGYDTRATNAVTPESWRLSVALKSKVSQMRAEDYLAQNVGFSNNRVNRQSRSNCPVVTQGGEISME